MAAPNPARQREARRRIGDLFAHPSSVWIIHYACQSFEHGQRMASPRVTALVARNLGSGYTETFSLHAEAELRGLSPLGVVARMDALERAMLDKVFAFLALNRFHRFVHWKMCNAVYGFAAIEHRYAVLGGMPLSVPEPQRFDLAWLIEEIYGSDYVEEPHFETLARLNGLPLAGFLPGDKEAEAFRSSRYLDVQRSTTCKVGLFFDVLHRVHDRTLKTRSSWWTQNLGRTREAAELFRDNPVKALAGAAIPVGGAAMTVWKLLGY